MCRICSYVTPGEPQVVLGTDKAFTFDYVFDTNSEQVTIYNDCVEKLVDGALKGYNATVLAYGQTGSGKTYTMGTGFDRDLNEVQEGIIPRAVRHLFSGIQAMQENPYDEDGSYLGSLQFSVAAQFMELYNEEIIDLLDPYSKGKVFKIHEDTAGSISIAGATIRPLKGPQDALNCLQQGALARTTASTNMNELSSRSHALFTILIRRQRVMTSEENGSPEDDLETLTSKFHFVDLAGSERLKRTGATGERAREGISINCGLLALGNVISALGDVTKKALHVPYRDSKLTRLLQDSLGGNSQTVMLACISPSDRDFMETLNTLKYANRARNIKNRVQINQDQSSRTISQLRREIAALQLEILEYKQGKRSIDAEGNAAISDTSLENAMLLADNKRLQQRLKAMQETINALTERNTELLAEKAMSGWNINGSDSSMTEMVSNYIAEIEKLKAKLIESEQMFQQLKRSQVSPPKNASKQSFMNEVSENPSNLINMAKRELEKERELLMSKSLPGLPGEENQERSSQDDGSDSESDTESDDKANELQDEINDIQSDIEIKTKLIEQLELSQQRMMVMKQHYEEKLNVLSAKITNTQKERDQVLANMGQSPIADQGGKMKKVRDEYERKLSDMQKELKKLHQAQKEHLRQQRELQAQDNQLRSLRQELTELKQIKIKLMRKMTDENNRHKEEDARRMREIAQLRKEARKQSSMIKSLQGSVAAKDQVLKRKTEEVSALRKTHKNQLSTKAQGRVPMRKTSENFHPRQARIKWDSLQRSIGKSARSKQAVIELERELERLLHEREQLSRDLSGVRKRQKIIESPELASEEDSIQANLSYIQENIEQIQNSIMELEEGKQSAHEQLTIQNILENIKSVEEAKFLIEKLCSNSILQACDVGLTHTRLKEKEALLNEVQQDSNIQQQLLQHVLARNPAIALSEVTISSINGSTNLDQKSINDTSTHSSRSPSPNNSEFDLQSRSRMRRRIAPMAQELLFGDVANGNNRDDEMSRSYTIHDSSSRSSLIPLARVPSAPGSLKDQKNNTSQNVQLTRQKSAIAGSPMFSRKLDVNAPQSLVPQSPRVMRRQLSNKTSPGLEDATEVPSSPPVYRRGISREEGDVFSRLGAGISDPTPGGSIKDFNGRMKVGSPLLCTHIVDGHSNSVLAIKASDTMLFTAAADRTCKVWDLRTGATPHCLSAHPGPVVGVEYDKSSKILFSASGAFIRTWDLRESNIRPIKTLCSSGVALSGSANLSSIPTGESPITALKMGTTSGNLYTAASDKVRFWDLRMFSCIGKLSGGHQAAVMCVTTWDGPGNTDYVATGSKDHYVKVFEVASTGGTVVPLLNLEPPHYDGVQALVVSRGSVGVDAELFSGSRDSGIKRWDLRNGELKQSMNNAHKGWVSGMTIYSDILLSACRGGLIRLWNVKSCDALAEMKTEASINDITCADNRIFTASNDGKVRAYRLSSAIRRLSQENR
ncbi:CLUMA_CG013706, isoform A [Clunio marinus]|uniref:CLUMA_CG013706, isoform A n=1 Tax=Clunio marinus TaxID=568069 RepID=A0A1J1ILK2_9DIPT|nr:CLUMA_CG013706, isoform A [Clunio marinus]